MAGMFCSLAEAAQRLGKTEEEITELINQGRLREFRDGPNLLLKVSEIEALAQEEGIELAPAAEAAAGPEPAVLPSLAPDEPPIELSGLGEEEDPGEAGLPELEPEAELPALEPELAEGGGTSESEAALDEQGLESLEIDLPEVGGDEQAAASEPAPAEAVQADASAEEATKADKKAEKRRAKEKKAKEKKARKKKAKPPAKPKPARQPATATASPSLWALFVSGLRNDNLIAILCLVLLILVIAAAVGALGYAAYTVGERFL